MAGYTEGPEQRVMEMLMGLYGPHQRQAFSPGSNPSQQASIEQAMFSDPGVEGFKAAQQSMGHQVTRRGGHQAAGMGSGRMENPFLDAAKQDASHRRDMKNMRDQLNLEAYFKNKELGDRLSMVQSMFGGGRPGRGFTRRETTTSQQMVNNAGNWEARPMSQTTETDMTYDILSQLLRG